MGEHEDDDGLLARIGSGDRHAFGRLMDRHADRVFTLARAVLGSAADAEDVTQDVFVTVWRKADDWRPGRRPLHDLALPRHGQPEPEPQEPGRRAARAARSGGGAAGPGAGGGRPARRGPPDAAGNEAVADLPESQRTAVTLTYTTGLSNAEAAAAMAISVKALEALLVRARRTLRETLGGDA